jgi:ABC-type branched-subunit amino acid transport system substrate-binding protein
MKKVLMLALMGISCMAFSAGVLAQDIKVGTLFDHTGALKEWGPSFQNGAELAGKQMAAAGLSIGFIHEDSGTSPEMAVKAAKKLVDEDRVVAVLGSASSGVIVAVSESVTLPGDVLMITPGATSAYITILPGDAQKDLLFRSCPSDALQGVVLGKLAASLYKSASIMYVNNAYGQGLAEQFKKSFQKRGGTVFTMLPHDESVAESYLSELREVYKRIYLTKPFRSGKSEVLAVFSYPEHAKVYVKEGIEKFKGKHFLFCDGSRSEELAEIVGKEALEGMMGTAPGVSVGESHLNFIADYKSDYNTLPTVPFIANAYDATAVLGLAIYAARIQDLPLTSKNIRDMLRKVAAPPGKFVGPGEFEKAFGLLRQGIAINYEGASGSIDFDENGDVEAPIEVWKYSDGKIVTYRMEYQIPEE